jgi:hypothetical protein
MTRGQVESRIISDKIAYYYPGFSPYRFGLILWVQQITPATGAGYRNVNRQADQPIGAIHFLGIDKLSMKLLYAFLPLLTALFIYINRR